MKSWNSSSRPRIHKILQCFCSQLVHLFIEHQPIKWVENWTFRRYFNFLLFSKLSELNLQRKKKDFSSEASMFHYDTLIGYNLSITHCSVSNCYRLLLGLEVDASKSHLVVAGAPDVEESVVVQDVVVARENQLPQLKSWTRNWTLTWRPDKEEADLHLPHAPSKT